MPDEVVEAWSVSRLEQTSVSAIAVRVLAQVLRGADTPALLGELPDLGV